VRQQPEAPFHFSFQEGSMSQAKPRHYLDALRVALAGARQLNSRRVAAYHVLPQGISCKADWAGWAETWYHATPRQQALLDVLQDLLDGGETDVPMIALKAALRLECPEAEIERSRDNRDAEGDSGYFFDDVLYGLYTLDAQASEQVFHGLLDRLMQPACALARPASR